MSVRAAADRDSWRLGALYGAYFGFAGIIGPYLPLYFQWRGLTVFEVGVLIAPALTTRGVVSGLRGCRGRRPGSRRGLMRAAANGERGKPFNRAL